MFIWLFACNEWNVLLKFGQLVWNTLYKTVRVSVMILRLSQYINNMYSWWNSYKQNLHTHITFTSNLRNSTAIKFPIKALCGNSVSW